MGVFVNSKSAAGSRHGVFAIDQTNAPLIQPTPTNVSCIVGQFPWGPDGVVFTPSSPRDRLNNFAPFGMDHTGSAYLSTIAAAWPDLRIYRVLGTGSQGAFTTLTQGFVSVLLVVAKWNGAAGNSIVATVTDATDGDPNHFNLTAVVSSVGGSTIDTLENLNYSGTGDDSVVDFTNSLLLGTLTKLANGRPGNGAYTLATGSDGAVASSDYIGTQGTGDKGFAVCEGDEEIRQIFTDDPGDSLRNAVNAGIQQHAEFMGDRVAFVSGNSGLSLATTQSDVSNYRSTRVVYMDPWVTVRDDSAGSTHAIPPQCFGASVASQLPPSTSIAWKGAEAGAMLDRIVSLVNDRGNSRDTNTRAGIATIFKHQSGGYRIEADPVTYAPVNPAKKSLRRTRVGDFIAVSFVDSVQDQVDAPNVPVTQQSIMNALSGLLANLKQAKDRDPIHNPFIKDYSVPVVASTESEIDGGELEIDVNVKVGSAIEQLFLGINYGESVDVTVS
jgi:hypothetical protein